jgi:hypothetical protein
MSELLNIATSLSNDSLTLFVGTGFSRHMTNDNAPTWNELMLECAMSLDDGKQLVKQLFKKKTDGTIVTKFPILVCAQMLELHFRQEKKNLKDEIVRIIKFKVNKSTIDPDRLRQAKQFFRKHKNINIITTNYDTLFSDFIIPKGRVITEGSTISKVNTGQNIFHIHGSVDKPGSIIATFNDYYNFLNSKNYFSRKFFTLLQETTVVIMGYSLEDFNLNAILNEVNTTRKDSFRDTDILYISREDLDPVIKEFYYTTYGIKSLRVNSFSRLFTGIENNFDRAKELIQSTKELKAVLNGTKTYDADFLKLKTSLHDILAQAAQLNIERGDTPFLNLLIHLLMKKKGFSRADGAWEQYHHLADWLLTIATRIVVKGSPIEEQFCDLAMYSFDHCSREKYIGVSWQAYEEWNTRWNEMKFENRRMLRDLIQKKKFDKDYEIDRIHIRDGG